MPEGLVPLAVAAVAVARFAAWEDDRAYAGRTPAQARAHAARHYSISVLEIVRADRPMRARRTQAARDFDAAVAKLRSVARGAH